MTARSREDELREVPLWKANKERWPPGVREIAMEEQDCLGIDRRGNLYWDGKPIELQCQVNSRVIRQPRTAPTETGLPGWGGRIRTQKCRRKISL